jgi:hypothetical protein
MKRDPKSPVPQAAPWTGSAVLENDRVPSPAAEKMKDVIGGRNLPGPSDPVAKGKRVRIPRSNRR